MKYVVGIFYVNRFDLLMKALHSIPLYWSNTIVIDNSWNRDLLHAPSMPTGVTVYEPPVPFSHSQSQNLLQQWGAERECDAILYMHSDAEAYEGTPEQLLGWISRLEQTQHAWGAIHTYFDTIAAFRMEAVKQIGPWDTNLPMYFSDIDWYRRMKLCSYELIQTGLGVTHHNEGASTVKSDPYLTEIHRTTFPLYEQYYIAKWGGGMGGETYTLPFNRFPINPVEI